MFFWKPKIGIVGFFQNFQNISVITPIAVSQFVECLQNACPLLKKNVVFQGEDNVVAMHTEIINSRGIVLLVKLIL